MIKTPKPPRTKAQVHNLHEFQFAKKVVEIPPILAVLKDANHKLDEYEHYQDVARVIWEIDDAYMMLQIYLEQYKEILNTKGRQR